jgi:hypothetical protein
MSSRVPTNADFLDEDSLPFDMRPPQVFNFGTETQPETDSQCTNPAWDQDLQHQQQPQDDIGWMNTDECRANNGMDPESEQALAVPPGGLTLPPMSGSAIWATRRIEQSQQSGDNMFSLHNESLDDWATSYSHQPSLFEDASISLPGTSTASYRTRISGTLSAYTGLLDHQNEEPSTATSDSFFASFDDESSYHIKNTIQTSPILASMKKSPSSDHSDILEDTDQESKPKRKRGRPRKNINEPGINNTRKSPTIRPTDAESESNRIPHNQVEQKYRNGLNTQLERLRETVAATTQHPDSTKMSKAMVLAGAVEHIKNLEVSRDELEIENKGLRKRKKKLRRDIRSAEE